MSLQMEFHVSSFIILITLLVLFVIIFLLGYKMVKYKSCGIFLFPLKENLNGDHFYLIGLHSNQLFRPVPQCDITLVLLSATGKHLVIIKNEANRDESLLRLGTSLVLSSTSDCLGSVESMSLVIHGDPNRWKLEWIKVTDIQHSLTWEFKIPNGVLAKDNYVNIFKGKHSKLNQWLRFHNWILLFRPHYISSRVGFLTLIYLISSSMLTSMAITIVASFIITSHSIVWVRSIGCTVSVLIHLLLDILLHLSQGSISHKNSAKFFVCFNDEWQNAQPSANAVGNLKIKISDATIVEDVKTSSSGEMTLKSESVINIRQHGIRIVRQIPVEDFSIICETSEFEYDMIWPKLVHLPQDEIKIRDSVSGIERPVIFIKELDHSMPKCSSVGFLPRIQEESETSINNETPPSFAYPYSPKMKRSRIDILRPKSSSETEKTSPGVSAHKYGYVYTFLSKTSMITIREPIVELSAEDEAAFNRVNIPISENEATGRPHVTSSSEMLFQDTRGTIWVPKVLSSVDKKNHLIKFFQHWQLIGNILQVMELRLSSLHAWYTQHVIMTNEIVAIERIRIEVLRLFIIFQVNKRHNTMTSTVTARSVPLCCVRSAARFTAIGRPSLDDHFCALTDILQNFAVQVTMLVIFAMKDFVSVTREIQVSLSGSVQYDLQSVVKHFIEEIQNLHKAKNRKVRHHASVGDRVARVDNPPVSFVPTATSFSSNSMTSMTTSESLKQIPVLKSTLSLQIASRAMMDHTTYFSETDVPPEEPPNINHVVMSAAVLSDVSGFVDGIVTAVKEILVKESAGNSLYDFVICRLINIDKNFRYSCHDFLFLMVTKLSDCIVENVVTILGKELHLHVRNMLTANLIRIVQFVTEKLPDSERELFKPLEYEGMMYLFPIDSSKSDAIEIMFRECVVRNCTPPHYIRNEDDLQNYKHELWLLKVVEGFIHHQWLDRSATSTVHLVSKAMPMLHNKLIVGCKIVDETISLVEMVEFDVKNAAETERPIPFEYKDFTTIITSLNKRLNSVLSEIHSCFYELNRIYLLTKLSSSEQEYVDRLVTTGIIRSFRSETIESVNESRTLDFTKESITAVRDVFLQLPIPIVTAKWQIGIKLLLMLNTVYCYGISFIFSFLYSTSTLIILCILGGVFLTDIFFVQIVKSFLLHKTLKWIEFRNRKKL